MLTSVLRRRIGLATLALTCWASAQAASQEVPKDTAAITELKANLRNLVVAVEAYYSD